MRRAGLLAAALVLASAPAAAAGTEIRGVDTSAYPEIRFTVETPAPSASPPRIRENGHPVAGLEAENLGRAKSVVMAVDRSVSMTGKPLAAAVAAARAFVAAKPAGDRIAVATFATSPVLLTPFRTATIDADTALRSISVDRVQGTTLYDALVLSGGELAREPLPGRVVIAVTDGNETRSSASLEDAIDALRDADASAYVIGIESARFTPAPLRRLARETGGEYFEAATSAALSDVYESIAEGLRRTWQVRYFTAARPGERISLAVGDDEASTAVRLPGAPVPQRHAEERPALPRPLLESAWGAFVLAGAVALLVLLGVLFALAAPRGSWLKSRLSPHVHERARETRREHGRKRERLALLAGLFRATERAFGHLRVWKRVQTQLDRADLPLRTVELVYVQGVAALALGLVAALAGAPTLAVLGALAAGVSLPYLVVLFKARRRLNAFDAQLPDLLTTVAASLKAGHSFRQGIQAVVDEGQEPASKEFKRVLAETRLGRPMDGALAEMSRRVGSKNLEFVLTAVTIQRQVGGSLAAIFDMVAETVRNRHQFLRKVKGLTAMGRASAYVLIGLPFFVALAVTVLNGEYMAPLYHTSAGHKLIVAGLVMIGFGCLVLKKIVAFRG